MQTKQICSRTVRRQGVCVCVCVCVCVYYLDASLARPLDPVIVVLRAAWTGAGALPQEVKRTTVTCSCRTGAEQTHRWTFTCFLWSNYWCSGVTYMSHLYVLKFIFSFVLYNWLYYVYTHITLFFFIYFLIICHHVTNILRDRIQRL